ncbi:MAG: hypothetical protein IJU54_02170 [Alphaproteobacteria bacterium]|nr:hypothetical protein [Alphaproteobacteria bacterium]
MYNKIKILIISLGLILGGTISSLNAMQSNYDIQNSYVVAENKILKTTIEKFVYKM